MGLDDALGDTAFESIFGGGFATGPDDLRSLLKNLPNSPVNLLDSDPTSFKVYNRNHK